jgi:hypothetical protein
MDIRLRQRIRDLPKVSARLVVVFHIGESDVLVEWQRRIEKRELVDKAVRPLPELKWGGAQKVGRTLVPPSAQQTRSGVAEPRPDVGTHAPVDEVNLL